MIEKDLNLVRKIVWSYVRSTPGLEFDDLFSEACIAYLDAEKHYNPSRGKKSTFMWHTIKNTLNLLIGKEDRTKSNETPRSKVDAPASEYYTLPESQILANERWRELMILLSPDARALCHLIINEPDIYLPLDRPKLCRGAIREALRSRGWSYGKIWKSFKELREALSNV